MLQQTKEKKSKNVSVVGKDVWNGTIITEIFLLGFQNLHIFKVPFVVMIIFIYCFTLVGNFLIIVLISVSKNLQFPMYFFICYLSISDILLATNIVPNMLHIVIHDGATISLTGCITQFYIFGSFLLSECFLLTVMSYDRYLAICRPLHYSSIMDQSFCIKLVAICWLLGFTVVLTSAVTISTLHFCGQNTVNHFFCDVAPLLELSCSDIFYVQMEDFVLAGPTTVFPFLIVIASYARIAFTIQKIKSNTGRQKAFATCSSHLAVVSIFYGTMIGIYVVPTTGKSQTINKLLSLLYTVVTPLLNPVIYSLRNKDIKVAFEKCISSWKQYVFLYYT